MKVQVTVTPAWLLVLLSLVLEAWGQQLVRCQWNHWGDWAECDACTGNQVRMRSIHTYAQFGGTECSGEASQSQRCNTTRGCPLEDGCVERFRCYSGQCISPALVCNGDQDCEEDGSDEQQCERSAGTNVCNINLVPPNVELTGKGFDVVTGQLRGGVINTKAFGGQCRKVFGGDGRSIYRLPRSLLGYNFQVTAENDFSDEFYNSSWSYVKNNVKKSWSTKGHHYETFQETQFNQKTHRLMIIKNRVEVAQFQNSPPEYLMLSEEFWKDLAALPAAYDYAMCRALIKKFGTHFLSEGSLGGLYQALLYIDAEAMDKMSSSDIDSHQCVTTTHWFLFFRSSSTRCNSFRNHLKQHDTSKKNDRTQVNPIIGGRPSFIAGLSSLDLQNPGANWDAYIKWAGSVRDFPTVIDQKLRPLYELVKEVPCAGLKRLHLERAIETYQTEEDPCHCAACQNNGQPILRGTTCTCICKPGTSGPACQHGAVLDGQPGVIDGGWTCWTAWGACSQGQRSRARTCSNPHPRMGGKDCSGEAVDRVPCEDEDLAHLRTMEPHCFDPSLSPAKSCKSPPPLGNGFCLDPKDVYPVGSKVVYSCIEGYHLLGRNVAECTEDLTWSRQPLECKRTVCEAPPLLRNVTATPWKLIYEIGEKIALSCPPGKRLEGAPELQCDSSLNWSPQQDTTCGTLQTETPEPGVLPTVGKACQPWEKLGKEGCVCKMPYECRSSLEVCATNLERRRVDRLSVCKIRALECLGRQYTLAEDSACDWLPPKATPCSDCQLWEKCHEKTDTCVCRELGEECSETGAAVCARPAGGTVALTMKECEAGLRRCNGEQISVVSLQPCEP